jgi:hypothetical protein
LGVNLVLIGTIINYRYSFETDAIMVEYSRRDALRIGGGAGLLLLGGTATVSADEDDSDGDGTAKVRVGHLSPDTPAVDVYVGAPGLDPTDPDTDPAVSGLSYPNFAPDGDGDYLELEAGTYDISVTPEGVPSVEAIDVDGFALEADQHYTVLAVGELDPEHDEPEIRALPLVDDSGDPDNGTVLVRLVHASPDAGEVELVVRRSNGKVVTTFEDVSFGNSTGYAELNPGKYTVDVGPGALDVDLVVEPGTAVTGYVVGNATPEAGGDGPLGAEVDDAELAAVTTLDATSSATGRGRGRGR